MDNQPIDINTLPIEPADASSPVPLYHQIENRLRELIQSGQLAPGHVLPPEIALSQAFAVGRQTMRSALARLVDDGLIMRKAGRGTVVAQQTDRTQFFLDRSFTRQMQDMGREARSRLLRSHSGVVREPAAAILHASAGASFLYMERLRFGDDEPIGLQQTTIITTHCPDLGAYDFNRVSLYEVLTGDYALLIHRLTHRASAALADPEQAALLQVEEGDPLLLVRTAAYLEAGDLIEATTSHYRTDHYEYSTVDIYSPC